MFAAYNAYGDMLADDTDYYRLLHFMYKCGYMDWEFEIFRVA